MLKRHLCHEKSAFEPLRDDPVGVIQCAVGNRSCLIPQCILLLDAICS